MCVCVMMMMVMMMMMMMINFTFCSYVFNFHINIFALLASPSFLLFSSARPTKMSSSMWKSFKSLLKSGTGFSLISSLSCLVLTNLHRRSIFIQVCMCVCVYVYLGVGGWVKERERVCVCVNE